MTVFVLLPETFTSADPRVFSTPEAASVASQHIDRETIIVSYDIDPLVTEGKLFAVASEDDWGWPLFLFQTRKEAEQTKNVRRFEDNIEYFVLEISVE